MIESVLVRSAATNVLGDVGGDPDDAVLVKQCLASDRQVSERARTLLCERHYEAVLDLATYMLRNRHDAEDATQTTFLRVFGKLHKYRAKGPLQAWVMNICRNHCLDLIRRARAHGSPAPLDDGVLAERANAVDQDMSIDLWTAIKKLPLEEREALCFYNLGWTSKQVAKAIGVPASTIRSRQARAFATLDRELRENVQSATAPQASQPSRVSTTCRRVHRTDVSIGVEVGPADDLVRRRTAR